MYLSGADITGIFPPFIIKHLDCSFLLELEDRQRERVPPLGALGSGDTVPCQLWHTLLYIGTINVTPREYKTICFKIILEC